MLPRPPSSPLFPYTTLFRSDKALEGFAMFALNQGEVCTCPSRALVQKSIYDRFMEKALGRVAKVKQGHPLEDRKSTRLNSSHVKISYAVFCLKKKNL